MNGIGHPEGGTYATTEGSAQHGSGWFLILADSSPRMHGTLSDCSIKKDSMIYLHSLKKEPPSPAAGEGTRERSLF